MRFFRSSCVRLLFVAVVSSLANAEVEVFLDHDHNFVLSGERDLVRAIDFRSFDGGIRPVVDSKFGPFNAILSNTPEHVSFFHVGKSLHLDGRLRLGAGWDEAVHARDDLEVVYTDDLGQLIPIDLDDSFYDTVDCDCMQQNPHRPPQLGFKTDDEANLVLVGDGYPLSTLHVRAGTIGESGPFDFIADGVFQSDHFVMVDGELVLDVKDPSWVSYELPGEAFRPLDARDLSHAVESDLTVSLDEGYRLVFHGSDVEVSGLDVQSSGGGLLPIEIDPANPELAVAPFLFALSNAPQQVTLGLLGSSVTIDGRFASPIRWNAEANVRDLQIYYGDGPTPVLVEIPDTFYEPCLENCAIGPEQVSFTLDPLNRFVVTGRDQEVSFIEFRSSNGQLLNGRAADPFDAVNSTASNRAKYTATAEPILLTGSHTLDLGITSADELRKLSVDVGYPDGTTLAHSVTPSLNWVLLVGDHAIDRITIESSEVSLSEVALPDSLPLIARSEMELQFAVTEDFSAEDLHQLVWSWGISSSANLFVSFELLDGSQLGPHPISTEFLVPEPSARAMAILASLALVLFRQRRKLNAKR